MPILGVIASSYRTAGVVDTGAMFPLQVITVGPAGASSISFTNIPNTYAHLQIRAIHRISSSADIALTFNAGSFTRRHYLLGDGASASASSDTTNGVFSNPLSTDIANTFGATIVDILDYTNTNKTKTIRSFTGKDINGSGGQILLMSQLYDWTGAITGLTLSSSSTILQNSQFALYGIKAAS